jgi:hypothetical protein
VANDLARENRVVEHGTPPDPAPYRRSLHVSNA